MFLPTRFLPRCSRVPRNSAPHPCCRRRRRSPHRSTTARTGVAPQCLTTVDRPPAPPLPTPPTDAGSIDRLAVHVLPEVLPWTPKFCTPPVLPSSAAVDPGTRQRRRPRHGQRSRAPTAHRPIPRPVRQRPRHPHDESKDVVGKVDAQVTYRLFTVVVQSVARSRTFQQRVMFNQSRTAHLSVADRERPPISILLVRRWQSYPLHWRWWQTFVWPHRMLRRP